MKHKANENNIMIRFMGLKLDLYLLLRNNHIINFTTPNRFRYFTFEYNNLYDI